MKSFVEISSGYKYTIVFENAEEVAEYGEHADCEKMIIPTRGNPINEQIEEMMIAKAKEFMKDKKWNTFRIEEERFTDWVFNGE